jgi:hypothetical protein
MPTDAELRGLWVHDIRFGMKHRHLYVFSELHRSNWIITTTSVRRAIKQLRQLGPGPVVMAETCGGGCIGDRMDWWGCKPPECEWCNAPMTDEESEYRYEGQLVCPPCIRFDDMSEDAW